MLDAYIYDGLRSPFGRYVGITTVRPDDLVATDKSVGRKTSIAERCV